MLLYILAFGSFGVIVVLVAFWATKAQEKYVNTLKVGDVVDYNGKPAKILDITGDKVRLESVVSKMSLGGKIDMNEYKFGN